MLLQAALSALLLGSSPVIGIEPAPTSSQIRKAEPPMNPRPATGRESLIENGLRLICEADGGSWRLVGPEQKGHCLLGVPEE